MAAAINTVSWVITVLRWWSCWRAAVLGSKRCCSAEERLRTLQDPSFLKPKKGKELISQCSPEAWWSCWLCTEKSFNKIYPWERHSRSVRDATSWFEGFGFPLDVKEGQRKSPPLLTFALLCKRSITRTRRGIAHFGRHTGLTALWEPVPRWFLQRSTAESSVATASQLLS